MLTKRKMNGPKDYRVKQYGLSPESYYIDDHGAIRNRYEKFHGSKKNRLRARRQVIEVAVCHTS